MVPELGGTALGHDSLLPSVQHQHSIRNGVDARQLVGHHHEGDPEAAAQLQDQLVELTLCANYLDIKRLLDVTCKTVANQMKGKTPEELRELFGIENDFTPEEYEEAKRENEWLSEH